MLSKIEQRDLETLCQGTSFRMPQIRNIKQRFEQLDKDGKDYVTVEDVIYGIPNISKHPLATQIID